MRNFKIRRGPRGGKGRIVQIKAAVTSDEKRLFSRLAREYYSKSVSDLIRDELIKRCVEKRLLPKDYDGER